MKDRCKHVVSFGEVLWDIYPEDKKLGGAPFNVAAHLTKLGTQGYIITKVGSDALGKEILKAIEEQNIQTNFSQIDYTFNTGEVLVSLDHQGNPTYDIKRPVAWDYIHTNLENLSLVERCDALIFGSLACRSERNLKTLKDLTEISQLNICDLNIRQDYYSKELIERLLAYSDILKVNEQEAQLLMTLFNINTEDFYLRLTTDFDIKLIIKTLGARGSEAFHQDQFYKTDGIGVEVIDTVGSGDAFLAAFVHHYLQENNINNCLAEGSRLGAFVATRPGAIPTHSFENITI